MGFLKKQPVMNQKLHESNIFQTIFIVFFVIVGYEYVNANMLVCLGGKMNIKYDKEFKFE